jgi:hypothetical protein
MPLIGKNSTGLHGLPPVFRPTESGTSVAAGQRHPPATDSVIPPIRPVYDAEMARKCIYVILYYLWT